MTSPNFPYHMVHFGNFFLLKNIKYRKPIIIIMEEFMKKAMRQHKNTLYLPSMWAMMEEIDRMLWIWEQFDSLWRNSYPPPIKNKEQLGLLLSELNKSRKNCKSLYRHCELDFNSWSALQDLPLESLVIRQTGNTTKEDKE